MSEPFLRNFSAISDKPGENITILCHSVLSFFSFVFFPNTSLQFEEHRLVAGSSTVHQLVVEERLHSGQRL